MSENNPCAVPPLQRLYSGYHEMAHQLYWVHNSAWRPALGLTQNLDLSSGMARRAPPLIQDTNRAPFLCYFKLCESFHSHWWIQTGVTVRKRPIWVKIDDSLPPVSLKFDRWPWKTIGQLPYAASSFVHNFRSHWRIQTGATVPKRPIWVKIGGFFLAVWPCNLTHDIEKQ